MTPVIQIPEGTHALLSASKSAQWLNCMGSLAATRSVKPRPASKYSTEGTVYHDVARRALQQGMDCAAFVGNRYEVQGFAFTVDAENADEAQKYVDAVRAIPGKRYIEVDLDYHELLGLPKIFWVESNPDKVQTGYSIPVAAGTGDAVILDYDHKIIWCIDLKFGRGDIVYAKENSQLRLYLAAAVARYELLGIEDDWTAIGAIHQPRVNHYDDEKITVAELKRWVAEQAPKAMRAYTLWTMDRVDEFDLTPGEKQCRWCPLSGNCAAQKNQILNSFPKGHAEAAIPQLTQITDEEIAEALDRADEIEHWLSAVRSEALGRALQGRVLPNWKLVTGRRGARDLNEAAQVQLSREAAIELGIEEVESESVTLPVEDALYFALKDAAFKPKELLTVAKLEKPLAKKAPLLWAALQEHITQTDGKPGLARMEDPRPPQAIVGHEFPQLGNAPAAGLL